MENEQHDNKVSEKETYTKEEFEAEVDRRVTDAVRKRDYKNSLKLEEAKKLAQMTAQEQYEYQLQQREEAIAQKEKELALASNLNEASKILEGKGISIKLADLVVDEDAEVMNERIKLLDKVFKDSVKEEVEKRLTTAIPKQRVEQTANIDLSKMSLAEIQELKNSSPEVYSALRSTK